MTTPASPAPSGLRLRAARRARGWTQARLAEVVEARARQAGDDLTLTASAVSRWEAGIFAPALRYRRHLIAELGFDPWSDDLG